MSAVASRLLELAEPARTEECAEVVTVRAWDLCCRLEARYGERRRQLLAMRRTSQAQFDAGAVPSLSPHTNCIREAHWRVRPAPVELADRKVEITGPATAKTVINALNSGANVFMADLEDATTPTWHNLIEGQRVLRDAVSGALEFDDPLSGKCYRLAARTAVLMFRPRGLHMEEHHVQMSGRSLAASFFDVAVFLTNCADGLLAKGSAPYLYLPKLETAEEARLWSDALTDCESFLGLPFGTIRATVLIETLPAAFQMDEILFELRDRILGLNCGRWDYLFSFIKRLALHWNLQFPDRDQLTMTQPFMRAYSRWLIATCHRRGAHAMGGMAAQIPIRNSEAANAHAMQRFRADKEREAADGHDGTWVAHPALVSAAREIFDRYVPGPNQIARRIDNAPLDPAELLVVPEGTISDAGMRKNVRVALLYLSSWLDGVGCVAIDNLMEDAATAEISRTQLWHWRRHGARMHDGRIVDAALLGEIIDKELAKLRSGVAAKDASLLLAARLLRNLVMADQLEEFLTTAPYEHLSQPVRCAMAT